MLSVVLIRYLLSQVAIYLVSQLLLLLLLFSLYFDGQALLGSMGAIFCVLVKKLHCRL